MIVNSILFVILFQGKVKYQVNFYFTNPSQNKLVNRNKDPFSKGNHYRLHLGRKSVANSRSTFVQHSFDIRSTWNHVLLARIEFNEG